jgi:hypothetical protein
MKYHNTKVTINGHTFDSKLEAWRYVQLTQDITVEKIELQPKYILLPSFVKNGKKHQAITYIADFLVTYKNGRVVIEDCKGIETEVFRIKRKLFEAKYPDLTIRCVTKEDMRGFK